MFRTTSLVSNHSPAMAGSPSVKLTKVSFLNPTSQARLAGLLFEPARRAAERRAGGVVVGPMFSVKEQAASVILRDAKKWRADLIVMGTHGRRRIRRVVLGSDAEHVVRESPVPVLLVRARGPARR